MNKRETAELELLREQLVDARRETTIAKALGFRGAAAPEAVPPPSTGHFNGWDYNAYRAESVFEAWSTTNTHGSGHLPASPHAARVSASQDGRRLYRTRLDALTALRFAVEADCAQRLARIDTQIEKERTK
jgi:hypothetical protein